MLWQLAARDARGNALPAGSVAIDATNNLVKDETTQAAKKTWALVGVHDLVVVETDDAVLIMPRCAAQEVRAVVEELRTRCHDLSDLLAAETSAEDILATVCPEGRWLPTDLLIQVACAMRAREIAAARTEPA